VTLPGVTLKELSVKEKSNVIVLLVISVANHIK